MSFQNKSVPFWPEEYVVDWGKKIPLLYNDSKNYLRNFPKNELSQSQVFRLLSQSRRCWIIVSNNDGRVWIKFIVSHYVINANVSESSSSNNRLWISSIFIANERDRATCLNKGCQISHDGIDLLLGSEFRDLELFDSFWATGEYANQLSRFSREEWVEKIGPTIETISQEETIGDEEFYLADTLRTFLDAEFGEEERIASQTAPFYFSELESIARKTVYRQFYQLKLSDSDYKRICDQKVSMLNMEDESLASAIMLEVVDLSPVKNESIIEVSVERQEESHKFPTEGMLKIAALPTLHKVRTSVVEDLVEQQTANSWLLKLAAGTYKPADFIINEVDLPPSEYPPLPAQKKAIDIGASSPDFSLVLGPPGTGKTTVILSWVQHFVAQGKRVLITSQNNKAVDNVLERLASEDDFECLRIGNENKVSSSLEPILLDNKARELQEKLFSEGNKALKALERAKSFLETVEHQSDSLTINAKRKSDALSELTAALRQREELGRTIAKHHSNQLNILQNIENLDTRISRITSERTGFFASLFRPWFFAYGIYLKHQRKKVVKTHANSIESESQNTQNSKIIESKIAELNIVIDEANRLLSQVMELRPDDTIPGVELPKLESVTHEFFQNISSTVQQVGNLIGDIHEWYEKLKSERQQGLYKMLLEKVDVVGATCIGINTKPLFKKMKFDVVIADESGQIQIHNLMVPLSRSSKVILVGDHKQLPPVVSQEILEEIEECGFDTELYEKSWFELLLDIAPENRKTMLDTQFRCPKEISDYVSAAFYDSAYFAGQGMEKKKPLFSWCQSPMIFVDTSKEANRHENSVQSEGRNVVQNNVLETNLVISLLEKAIKDNPDLNTNREIGIIVPYANHVSAIQKAISKAIRSGRIPRIEMPLNELVASVDSFQGQERDLIIFPFTRSNKRGSVGFLADWRRLNVAQTRAKKQLIMIGDLSTLAKEPREGAPDYQFKKAMQQLKQFVSERNGLTPSASLLPPHKKNDGRNKAPSKRRNDTNGK